MANFLNAFNDMKENAKAQHKVDKANFLKAKANGSIEKHKAEMQA